MKITASILFSVTILLMSCGVSEEYSEKVIPVTVTVAGSGVISSCVVAACRLESGSESVVTALNPGRILEVAVCEGDEVQAGDILVELSSDQQYSSAAAASSAKLMVAGTAASNAENNLHRAERLVAEGAISESEYEMAVSRSATSEADARQALAGYLNSTSMAESGKILAPFGGTVTRIWAKEGNVSSGPLVSLSGNGIMEAELLISDSHFQYLVEGLPVIFTTPHYPGELFAGEVKSFSSSVDRVSGLVSVIVQLHDDSGRLRSGMTGNAILALETSENAVVLPLRALLHSNDSSWEAAVIRHNTAVIVPVETGIVNGMDFEITAGIEPGDSVILLGNNLVDDGSPVRVVTR